MLLGLTWSLSVVLQVKLWNPIICNIEFVQKPFFLIKQDTELQKRVQERHVMFLKSWAVLSPLQAPYSGQTSQLLIRHAETFHMESLLSGLPTTQTTRWRRASMGRQSQLQARGTPCLYW
jgi:hypothetical protein